MAQKCTTPYREEEEVEGGEEEVEEGPSPSARRESMLYPTATAFACTLLFRSSATSAASALVLVVLVLADMVGPAALPDGGHGGDGAVAVPGALPRAPLVRAAVCGVVVVVVVVHHRGGLRLAHAEELAGGGVFSWRGGEGGKEGGSEGEGGRDGVQFRVGFNRGTS